jgi:hypothetical protein
MRGAGEGHYPWELEPGSMMTNAMVTATVPGESSAAPTRVPPQAPIVTFASAERVDLKVGAPDFLSAAKNAEGKLATSRVIESARKGSRPRCNQSACRKDRRQSEKTTLLQAPGELESQLEKNLRELRKALCPFPQRQRRVRKDRPGCRDRDARLGDVAHRCVPSWSAAIRPAAVTIPGRSKKCSPRLRLPSMDRAVLNQRCASAASL